MNAERRMRSAVWPSVEVKFRFRLRLRGGGYSIFLFLVALAVTVCSSPALAQYQPSSVLSEGEYYKLAVTEDGIYKIDYDFLEKIGASPEQIDPQQIGIYGQRGGMLDQANSAPPQDDVKTLSVFISGEEDGAFGKEDYVLFYAEGPNRRTFDAEYDAFRIEKNLYDTANYYFLSVQAPSPARIVTKPHISFRQGTLVTEYQSVYHHETEQQNLLGSGRTWVGEVFTREEAHQDFPLPTEGSANVMQVEISVVGRSTRPSFFEIQLNGQPLGTVEVEASQKSEYGYRARQQTAFFYTENIDTASLSLRMHYESATDHEGYLDYLTINTQQPLAYRQSPLRFSHPATLNHYLSTYQVTQTYEGLHLWDITDPLAPQDQQFRQSSGTASFTVYSDTLRSFLLFDPQQLSNSPTFVEKIASQNLHGLATPQLLILTPDLFAFEANRLAQFRQEHDGLTTVVVPLSQIYNEFSSGRQDVTALRNFIRMLYQRDSVLRYVLLFGDASYNYYQDRDQHVPTYQSRQSWHSVHSYSSDDYYGFMDEDEGMWEESGNTVNSHNLELGIGRLPVSTLEEARTVVDKLIHYATHPDAFGPWRKQLLFVADDGDQNKHQHQSDYLASLVEAQYPQFAVERLFMDAYPQEEERAPQVRSLLDQHVRRGTLLVDFIGHGGETAWTNEHILDIELIEQWDNYDRLPVFLTATCEFGRFDDPARPSGAEVALLSERGGAIALLTTTRPVFAGTNFQTSSSFYENAFIGENGQPLRLGDMIRRTKNGSIAGTINRNFALLGDPSMALAYPSQTVSVTQLEADGVATDTIHPLQTVTLQGQVNQPDGVVIDDSFNGIVYVDFYAQPDSVTTLGDESASRLMTFQNRHDKLFQGKATVSKGAFTLQWVVPKNLRSAYALGKISLYAVDDTQQQDASGVAQVYLGGEAQNAEADNTPPAMTLFLNQEILPVNTTVRASPTLIARLSDEHGINTLDGEYGLTALIDGYQTVPLNDWYEAELDNYQRGKLTFPLSELSQGTHTLELYASDTYLNTAVGSLSFEIVGDSVLFLENFNVYPNPTSSEVNFTFSVHPDAQPERVVIDLFSATGEQVQHVETMLEPSIEPYTLQQWLASSDLKPGMYLYRLVLTNQPGEQAVKTGRLLVR